jgi:hypothetical protein
MRRRSGLAAYHRIVMPRPSTAELTRPIAFPEEVGEPVWQERRRFPVATLYGVPAAFLGVTAIAAGPLVVHAVLAAATAVTVGLLVRARRHALIETYTISDRFVAIEQPRGGRVAIPIETLTRVTLRGDTVRLESTAGVVTLGFVSRRRALLRALERVAPGAPVEDENPISCPTCAIRY